MNASSREANPGRQPTPLQTAGHGSQLAVIEQDAAAAGCGVEKRDIEIEDTVKEEKKDELVTWRSLPHRRQLIILTLSRLSEPLVQTSLQVRPFHRISHNDS